jgi:hypothetical protein
MTFGVLAWRPSRLAVRFQDRLHPPVARSSVAHIAVPPTSVAVDSETDTDFWEMPMFTSIGLPQFALIVVILIAFIAYAQRHRF